MTNKNLSKSMNSHNNLFLFVASQKAEILTKDEERHLIVLWKTKGDMRAKEKLLRSYLRLVISKARKFSRVADFDELVAAGNEGLLQALDRFDPEFNNRFYTYARLWVSASIRNYVLANYSLVRLAGSSENKRMFFRIRAIKNSMGIDNGSMTTEQIEKISKTFGVSTNKVREINYRVSPDVSLDAKVAPNPENESGMSWIDTVADQEDNPETVLFEKENSDHLKVLLNQAMAFLNEKEAIVIKKRYAENPANLATIAKELGMSHQGVQQIQQRAIKKLKDAIQRIVPSFQDDFVIAAV